MSETPQGRDAHATVDDFWLHDLRGDEVAYSRRMTQ